MFRSRSFLAVFCCLITLSLTMQSAVAAGEPEANLYRAFYLEQQVHDYAEAKPLYDRALKSDLRGDLRQAAQCGSDRCRDQLAAQDFATLMPPDTLVYVELNRPGKLLEKLAGMMGLSGKNIREILSHRPNIDSSAPFYIPQEMAISPALFEWLNGFGGAAVALTDFDFDGNGPPSGVLVLHHGDVTFLKGILETAFQFAPTAKKIQDIPTFSVQVPDVGQVTGVLTESLAIIGTSRVLVEGVVNRLTGKDAPSLANNPDLQDVFHHRPDATLFAYGNLHEIFALAKTRTKQEDRSKLTMANALADLDHLRWATMSMGIDEGHLGAKLAIRYDEHHHSIVYNMMRLPPMTRDCLRNVPPQSAAIFGMGLNPVLAQAAVQAAEARSAKDNAVTGFDIPREIFGNIREFCLFSLPGKMVSVGDDSHSKKVSNGGIVFAVNDVARSKALWDEILRTSALVAGGEPVQPKQMKIGKTPVTAYPIPDFGKVYLSELDGCIAVGLTRSALKAVIRTHNKKKSILDDPQMGSVIAHMPPDSSLVFAANIGRLAGVMAGSGDAGTAMVVGPAVKLCRNTIAWFGMGQSPNQFTLQGAVTGLPNINEALKQFGPMLNSLAGMSPRVTIEIVKSKPKKIKGDL